MTRQPSVNQKLSNQSILIVEDESFILKLIEKQLNNYGNYNITFAADGQQAIDRLDDGKYFDLIISDLNMPNIDGIELMRRLSDRRYNGGIILVSGEDEKLLDIAKVLAKALRLNLNGVLKKPVQLNLLVGLLENNNNPERSIIAGNDIQITETDIKNAIDNLEMIPYYQPRISLSSMMPVSVEALVRWEHPNMGQILPGLFVHIAEKSSVAQLLTQSMLKQSIANYKKWKLSNIDLKIAVNTTVHDIEDVHFPEMVEMLANAENIPISNIVLELTESMLMKKIEKALDTFLRLRLKGVTLSVDDFGTGYSNLALLKKTPFTELKIDRSLVQNSHQDPDGFAILEASIVMGKKLGMHVIVEGIESIDELEMAKQLGADEAQGFYIAKPMSADDIMEWVKNWRETHY